MIYFKKSLILASLFVFLFSGVVFAQERSELEYTLISPMYDPNSFSCEEQSPVSAAPATNDLKSFVDAYAPSAFNVGKSYGIPYETILAQGIIESGYGKSSLTTEAYNFFGIKAGSTWSGPVWTGVTYEEVNGQMVETTAEFRKYPNAEEGFNGYGEFITTNSRYKPALQYPTDPYRYLEEIKKAGYATDSKYVETVSSVIKGIEDYIASTNILPPSSEVDFAASPPASTTTGSDLDCVDENSPNASAGSVVKIAEQEFSEYGGVREYSENVLKYTSGRREAWCANFVSWVFKEAGTPFKGGAYEDWEYPSVLGLQTYFKQSHTYFAVGEQTPQPGDVAFYIGGQTPGGGSTEHVNIVVEVKGGEMVTVGGNEGDTLQRNTHEIALGSSSLVGFGRYK